MLCKSDRDANKSENKPLISAQELSLKVPAKKKIWILSSERSNTEKKNTSWNDMNFQISLYFEVFHGPNFKRLRLVLGRRRNFG